MSEVKYRAIKYIRLSNAENGKEESDSVGNQRKLIDEFLKKHLDIEVVDEKVDDGWSGILFDRPAFKEMMHEIEQGNVNCVITKEPYVKQKLKISQTFFQPYNNKHLQCEQSRLHGGCSLF